MKKTVVRDYKKICRDWGIIQDEQDFNKSESKHEYSNGSYIDFLGADVNDLGKGFRRDLLYINEADKLEVDTAVQFISRAGLTIIDYNPDSIFWGNDYITENNFIVLTFEDNEFLSASEVKSILDYKQRGFHNPELLFNDLFKEENIKSKYWSNKWRVYGLGLVGQLDGVVLENWDEINEIPTDARLICKGIDFGYATSKFACVDVYKWNSTYIFDEVVYSSNLTNQQASQKIKEFGHIDGTIMYCDSAEPKSIAELRVEGLNAVKCDSKTDIKAFSIQKLNKEKFYITKRSTNIVDEARCLVWDEKTGKPQKSKKDHAMDAIFYAVGSEGKYDGSY
jgi:phage terminase large subunit